MEISIHISAPPAPAAINNQCSFFMSGTLKERVTLTMIDAEFAAAMARTALRNVATEYPYKLDQVLGSDDAACSAARAASRFPRQLRLAFVVHMHWTLARLLRIHPHHPDADATRSTEQRLTAANMHGELATLSGPHRGSFERPYGWGWLLKLAAELKLLAAEDRAAARWFAVLAPLAQAFADRFIDFLPRATYPTRAGTHGNSAFALLLALDYCETVQHRALHRLIAERANHWFGVIAAIPPNTNRAVTTSSRWWKPR